MPYLIEKNGDPRRTRTFDPMVKSHLLYRLSYRTTSFAKFCINPNFQSNFRFYRLKLNLASFVRIISPILQFLNQPSIIESGRIIVWSRSGPVEIKPISTPIEFDRNSTYSRALVGKSSILVVPKVSDFQPSSVS